MPTWWTPRILVQMKPVQIALTQGSTVVVASGLQAGERVVTDGQEKLQAGSRVAPQAPARQNQSYRQHRIADMSISRPFILRPIATSLLMTGLLLVGIVAYRQLPISALPQVDYPTIQVVTFYPGASPDVTASSITAPLERQFGELPGLSQMTSSSSFGASVITLQFTLEENIDVAEQEVQAAINSAQTYLPADLPTPPIYSKVNPADAPILTLAMTSDSMPLPQVEDLADTTFAQKISQLPGVGLVSISGGQKPAVRIMANPTALASYGMSLEQLRTVIAQVNVDQAKGQLQDNRQAFTIGANDQLLSPQGYADTIVAYKNGNPVRLSDVATVITGPENVNQAAWMNNTPAVILNIQRQPGANIIKVVDSIKLRLKQLQSNLPASVKVTVLTDRTNTIRASVKDVQYEMMLTIVLVVLVIFVFLRTLSATIIPSIAVPLSLVGTFGVMYLLGYSLDNLSLMALTISTGFVVDDAIVMIENIERYIEEGHSPLEAALQGAAQIGFTIVSLTVSLIAVLIPLLFMGDIVGRLFREFAVTLSVTILFSAIISLTLTPMMCSLLLRQKDQAKHGRLYEWSERAFANTIAFYGRTVKFVLKHQTVTLLVTIGTLVATIWMYIVVPKGFFPVQDTGVIMGITDAPESISFAAMSQRQRELATAILKDKDVVSLSSFIGVDGTNTTPNSGRLQINLKSRDERDDDITTIMKRLQQEVAGVEGITLYMQPVQDLTVEDRVSRTQYQFSLEDADPNELATWTTKMLDQAEDPAGTARCRHRPAEPGRAGQSGDRSRHGFAIGRNRQRDRQHFVRCVRPAAGVDHVHAVEPVPRRARSRSQFSRRSRFAEEYLCAGRRRTKPRNSRRKRPRRERSERRRSGRHGAAGAAQRDRTLRNHHRASDHQPPGAVPGGHDLVQPRQRRFAGRGGQGD